MAEAAPDAVTEDDREALAVQAYPDGEYTSVATNLALREAFLRGYEARAAVPDAATEEGRWYQLYEKGVEERVELRAECDAALAAMERVRALHREVGEQLDDAGVRYTVCEHCTQVNRYGQVRFPCATRAALDEAPEPEWEYGREYVDEAGDPHIHTTQDVTSPDGHRADGSPYRNYQVVRRRKAGPWLPVEGEKP